MFINILPAEGYAYPEVLPAALEHLRPAIGPLSFRLSPSGSLNGSIPFRRRRDGQRLKGNLALEVHSPDSSWGAWQTVALNPLEPNFARVAVRSNADWYPTRASWLLAWAVLQATVRLLLGPENEPHPLPKSCLNHAEPADRVGAFALIRGAISARLVVRRFRPVASTLTHWTSCKKPLKSCAQALFGPSITVRCPVSCDSPSTKGNCWPNYLITVPGVYR